MKRLLFVLLLGSLFVGSAWAEKGSIECVKGNCDGWSVWYERNSLFDKIAVYHFENNTGTTAFKILVNVNFYDNFGVYLGRITYKLDGPIHQQFPFKGSFPEKSYKVTCDIYWSDKY